MPILHYSRAQAQAQTCSWAAYFAIHSHRGFRDNSSEPVTSLLCLEWQPSAWALVQTRATGGDVGYFVLCVYTCTQDWRVHQSWLCKCTEVWAQQGWRGGCQASQHQQGKIELATATTGQARNTSLQYWSVLSTQVTLHSLTGISTSTSLIHVSDYNPPDTDSTNKRN